MKVRNETQEKEKTPKTWRRNRYGNSSVGNAGTNGFVADIDFKSQHSRSQTMRHGRICVKLIERDSILLEIMGMPYLL